MNWFKQIFHKHKWQVLGTKKIITQVSWSLNDCKYKTEDEKDGIMVVQKCIVCDEETAYMSDGVNKRNLDVVFAKQQIGLLP